MLCYELLIMASNQLSHESIEFITQIIQKLPDVDDIVLPYDRVLVYKEFLQLYGIDLAKLADHRKLSIVGAVIGIGMRYGKKSIKPVNKDCTIDNFSIFLFPDNKEYRRQAVKFFRNISLKDLDQFYTWFNLGKTCPRVDHIPYLFRVNKYLIDGIHATYQ